MCISSHNLKRPINQPQRQQPHELVREGHVAEGEATVAGAGGVGEAGGERCRGEGRLSGKAGSNNFEKENEKEKDLYTD